MCDKLTFKELRKLAQEYSIPEYENMDIDTLRKEVGKIWNHIEDDKKKITICKEVVNDINKGFEKTIKNLMSALGPNSVTKFSPENQEIIKKIMNQQE